jgi:hypothetical protein
MGLSLSSPGLTLYEALSSFRLYLLPEARRGSQEVRQRSLRWEVGSDQGTKISDESSIDV